MEFLMPLGLIACCIYRSKEWVQIGTSDKILCPLKIRDFYERSTQCICIAVKMMSWHGTVQTPICEVQHPMMIA